MNDWSNAPANSQIGVNGNGSHAPRVSILVAAPPGQIGPLTNIFRSDARFNLAATATSAEDVRAKLAVRPSVVLADAQTFAGLEELAAVLGAYEGSLFVILPEHTGPSVIEAVKQIPATRSVTAGDPNLPELAGNIYAAMQAELQLGITGTTYGLGQNGPP